MRVATADKFLDNGPTGAFNETTKREAKRKLWAHSNTLLIGGFHAATSSRVRPWRVELLPWAAWVLASAPVV